MEQAVELRLSSLWEETHASSLGEIPSLHCCLLIWEEGHAFSPSISIGMAATCSLIFINSQNMAFAQGWREAGSPCRRYLYTHTTTMP